MHISNLGNTRLVILFPTFVVKIAKFKILWILARVWVHITGKTKKRGIATLRGVNNSLLKALSFFLFAGVIANWQEYRFWKKYKHLYVAETYFSFFGLFNIQARGACVDITSQSWQDYLARASGMDFRGLQEDFLSDKNLSFISGKLVVHDYGHQDTRQVIISFGSSLFS